MKPLVIAALALLLLGSCSINRMALRAAGNALAGTGSSGGSNGNAFTRDDDPELVADALPMLIKTSEAILEGDPENDALMVSTGSLCVMYANAFVEGPVFLMDTDRYKEKKAALERAKRLYVRGQKYVKPAFERRYPGFWKAMDEGRYADALSRCKKSDMDALYWYAGASLSAFALAPTDLDVSMEVPGAAEMLFRARALDETWNGGAVLDALVSFYNSIPGDMGGDPEKARSTWERLAELKGKEAVGTKMSYAVNFVLKDETADPDSRKKEFGRIMAECAETDIDADPSSRLLAVLAKRKAVRYLEIIDTLF